MDTGSTDGTVGIARSFGAVLGEHAWDDDFSAARNSALELATGEWVLSLDADEWLMPGADTLIRTAMSDESCVITPLIDSGSSLAFSNPRLFARHGARWAGRLHENIVVGSELMTVPMAALIIRHSGYERSEAASKAVRNRRIIERIRAEDESMAEVLGVVELCKEVPPPADLVDRLRDVAKRHCSPRIVSSDYVFKRLARELLAMGKEDEAVACARLAIEKGLPGLWSYYVLSKASKDRTEARALARAGLAYQDYEPNTERMREEMNALLR